MSRYAYVNAMLNLWRRATSNVAQSHDMSASHRVPVLLVANADHVQVPRVTHSCLHMAWLVLKSKTSSARFAPVLTPQRRLRTRGARLRGCSATAGARARASSPAGRPCRLAAAAPGCGAHPASCPKHSRPSGRPCTLNLHPTVIFQTLYAASNRRSTGVRSVKLKLTAPPAARACPLAKCAPEAQGF